MFSKYKVHRDAIDNQTGASYASYWESMAADPKQKLVTKQKQFYDRIDDLVAPEYVETTKAVIEA